MELESLPFRAWEERDTLIQNEIESKEEFLRNMALVFQDFLPILRKPALLGLRKMGSEKPKPMCLGPFLDLWRVDGEMFLEVQSYLRSLGPFWRFAKISKEPGRAFEAKSQDFDQNSNGAISWTEAWLGRFGLSNGHALEVRNHRKKQKNIPD